MRERGPDEWQREAVQDDAEHQKIDRLGAVHPVGAVKRQDECSGRREREKHYQENIFCQRRIPEAPFQTFLSSFRRGVARKGARTRWQVDWP